LTESIIHNIKINNLFHNVKRRILFMHNSLKGHFNRKAGALLLAAAAVMSVGACTDKPADIVSTNLSNAADNFRINRQIDFVNTINGQDLLTIRGLCSLGNRDAAGQLTVTCKTGVDEQGNPLYIKDFLGLSATVTYVVQQLGSAEVSEAQYSVTWNPGALVPDFNSPGGAQLTPTASPDPATSSKPSPTASSQPSAAAPTPLIRVVPVPVTGAGAPAP
jgi:hypothetical protein